MSQITDIKEQMGDLITFKHISSAFTEAAAVKLANIRTAFKRNDRFFSEITHIYHLIKTNAEKIEAEKTNNKNYEDKKITVALTSNQRFFGHLNNAIMISFVNFSKKNYTDRLVIGLTGDSYMRALNYKQEYQSINFKADIPDNEERNSFLKAISGYKRVTLFYPKFISIVRQEIGTLDLTGMMEKEKTSKQEIDSGELNILFEPELSKVLSFFEDEVKMILFKRVLLETELARTAARLLEMSQAEERTDIEIKQKISELRKVTSSILNAHLLETFSGIRKWKHGISNRKILVEEKNRLLFK